MPWESKTRLPHVLRPAQYFEQEHYARELERLFEPAWHCIACTEEIPHRGNFVTRELLGRPLIVRNDGAQVRAFLNSCAHRHCMLTNAPKGSTPQMRCQYHGWEYDKEGRVCVVPDAKSFVPVKKGAERLTAFHTEMLGKLVFVSLREKPQPLHELLAPQSVAFARAEFGERWRMIGRWQRSFAVNWKVPVENSLESYHIPSCHPTTFVQLPDDREVSHRLGDRFTEFDDGSLWSKQTYHSLVARLMRRTPRRSYCHHHSFPSLLFASSPVTSFLQTIIPSSPTACHTVEFLFAHIGDDDRLLQRALSSYIASEALPFHERVCREDAAVYEAVQRGLCASPHQGVIGRREERIHIFHEYVQRLCADGASLRKLAHHS